MARLGLGDLIAAGPRAVSRYTGTLLGVFVVQSLVVDECGKRDAVSLEHGRRSLAALRKLL